MTTTKEYCTYFENKQCSSCQLLHLSYEDAVQEKYKALQEILPQSIAPIKNFQGFHTRNKAKFVVSGTIEDPMLGIPDNRFEIINCPLHEIEINIIAQKIKKIITETKIAPYNISEQKGELKYLIIFQAPGTNELMLRFVLRSKESIDRLKKNIPQILELSQKIKTISCNIQPEHKAIIDGPDEIYLNSAEDAKASIGEILLFVKPQSFFQTNSKMMQELYKTAKAWVKDLNINQALDLYCGVGGFSFSLAPVVTHITGVEISKLAIESANKSKSHNNILNISFVESNVENSLSLLTTEIQLVLVNPPRRGLDKNLLQKLNLIKPNYILYSSCNPDTLKENLNQLEKFYSIEKVLPFDMFAYSKHWEVLVLLKLKNPS